MAIPILVSIEAGDAEVDLTFLIEREGDDEWSVDDQYIEVSEDGGPRLARTLAQLYEVYDSAAISNARAAAIARAIDEWRDEDEHDLDDIND